MNKELVVKALQQQLQQDKGSANQAVKQLTGNESANTGNIRYLLEGYNDVKVLVVALRLKPILQKYDGDIFAKAVQVAKDSMEASQND